MVAILLCGSKEPWALGVLAVLIGATALFASPKYHVSRWLTIPVLLGLALCLVSFLPASWFPMPEWRETVQRDFGVILPFTRSPQPGITFESWLVVAVVAVWLVCCASRGFASSERRLAIRVFAVFASLLACVSLVISWKQIHVPFWQDPWDKFAFWNLRYLGPFPNRNLFSELMAASAALVFAATYDAFRHNQRVWIPLALTIVPIFAAVLQNTSRTGVALFFVGVGAWMFTATFQKRSAPRVAAATAILLVLATGFMLFGNHIKDRVSIENFTGDSRLQMFAGAIKVINTAPVFGIGLGNFEPVFALTRSRGDLYSRAYHPESDWLWFGAEAGVPCLLLGIAIVAAIALRFGPWRTHEAKGRRDRRLRNAAGIGALLLCGAGLVDPAMHAPGFFAFGCLMAGLALKPSPRGEVLAGATDMLLRRAVGVLCVIAGIAWFMTAANIPVIRGNSLFRQIFADAVALSAKGDDAAALEKWNEAAALKPLQYNVYFERAKVKLRMGYSSREALSDFARCRHLEPHNPAICRSEFDFWLTYDPISGMPALRETLKRDPVKAVEFLRGCLAWLQAHPELRPHLAAIAQTDPKLMLVYLPFAKDDEFKTRLADLLAAHPTLKNYTPEERQRLFQVWYQRGDAAQLIQQLEKNEDWQRDGWSVLAAHKAKEGNYRAAYEVALSHVSTHPESAPRPLASVADLKSVFKTNPSDLLAGFNLAEAQRREAKYDDALTTLDQLAKLPKVPLRVLYERGVTLAGKGDYTTAWQALRDYHQRSQQGQKTL